MGGHKMLHANYIQTYNAIRKMK